MFKLSIWIKLSLVLYFVSVYIIVILLVPVNVLVRLISTEHYSLASTDYLCEIYTGEWFYFHDKRITDDQLKRSSNEENYVN